MTHNSDWAMRRAGPLLLLGAAGGLGVFGASAYIGVDPQRRRKATRMVQFWSYALPVYGRYRLEEFLVRNAPEEEKATRFKRLHTTYAKVCLDRILTMRGLYVKLGQLMTTRNDYAPPEYQQAFFLLQDAVPARPFGEIKALVERELGRPVGDVFASIEEEPLGAATIGQVHGAVLRNGDRVVIKVQYPEVEQLFMEDLQTVKAFSALLQPEMSPMLDEMERQFLTEFDFSREGWALDTIGGPVNAKFGPDVHVPRPYRQLCSRRVCVMERLDGHVKLVDGLRSYFEKLAIQQGITARELMSQLELSGKARAAPTSMQMSLYRTYLRASAFFYNAGAALWNWSLGWVVPNVAYMSALVPINHVHLVDQLLKCHAFEIFELGVFNGDPHCGNILLGPNETIGLIDYGQVKQLTLSERQAISRLIVALCSNDPVEIVQRFRDMGFDTAKHDPWVVERTARFFFQDDTDPTLLRKRNGDALNLQQFMEYLNKEDATTTFPEYSFMVVRVAMLLRGLASHLGLGVDVARVWLPYAVECLKLTPATDYCIASQPPMTTRDKH